jgi:hypothetical protein
MLKTRFVLRLLVPTPSLLVHRACEEAQCCCQPVAAIAAADVARAANYGRKPPAVRCPSRCTKYEPRLWSCNGKAGLAQTALTTHAMKSALSAAAVDTIMLQAVRSLIEA